MERNTQIVYPCRIEGWLDVCDKPPEPGIRGSSPAAWEPYFCVLLQDVQTLTAYRSEELSVGDADLPRVRLDGGAQDFRHRWGIEPSPPPLLEEDEDSEVGDASAPSETASLREEAHAASPVGEWLVCLQTRTRTSTR